MPENGCDLVVVGASAGGVEALTRFARALPVDFGAPVLVVLHVPASSPSVLPGILSRVGALPATHAVDGEALKAGHIYIAPPDCHMVVSADHIELARTPRENGHRPAIDTLFRSAAQAHDGRTAGVVLSGTLDDGTAGLSWIKLRHGATLVQDPDDAIYPAMPENAISFVEPDYVQGIEELVDTLVRLTANANGRSGKEASMDQAPNPAAEQAHEGEIAPFSCPACGGTLWETEDAGFPRYRCRIGHAYTLDSLAVDHSEAVERALSTAYRALEEHAAMSRRIARRLTDRGRTDSAARFERQAATSTRQAGELRVVLDALAPTVDASAESAAHSG